MASGLFRTKSLDAILSTAEHQQTTLRRSLGPVHVTLLGIGGIIGAGIFATVGEAAAGVGGVPGAGPSLVLSFVITAIVCGFTALCYAEFASMVPVAGSAYTYSYSTLGELIAWIIGWDLILEYAVGNTAVAISWANYFRRLLDGLGIPFPLWLATDYRTAALDPAILQQAPHIFGVPIVFNLLAFFIVAAITVVLVWGIRESANFNAGMVAVKILVLTFFVAVALYFVSPSAMAENWVPFQPRGWNGTLGGAALVFFAYIGFDAVSTVAEETRNPKRDLPIGIICSLVICTVLYIIVAAAFTGIVPYSELKTFTPSELAESLTMALDRAAPNQVWATNIIAFGSVIAHTAVLLVFQMGQPRIFFSMARDGLLPPVFTKVHPRFRTPHVTTVATGIVVGIVAAFTNISEMVALTNIGTLFAFMLVCIGITILRFKDPHRPRPFRVPFGPVLLPLLGAASCLGLMYYLPPASWWRFVGWLVLGMAVYTSYGYQHSALRGPGVRASSLWLKLAALGMVAAAVAMMVLPHQLSFSELLQTAQLRKGAFNARAFYGVYGIGAGLILVVLGFALHKATSRPTSRQF